MVQAIYAPNDPSALLNVPMTSSAGPSVRAEGTQGGRIAVSADRVLSNGRLSADGSDGGGEVRVVARNRLLETQSAEVSARGGEGRGGEIRVENHTDGKGCSFTVELPRQL